MVFGIVDFRANDTFVKNLTNVCDAIIKTKKANTYDAICGHPDISVCKLGNDEIITAPMFYDYYKNALPDINVICGDENPGHEYPNDVLYNISCFGESFIHNTKYTDKKALAVIEQKFSKHINVRQGYSKCATAIVGNNAIITEDEGIAKEAKKANIKVCKITKGDVKLENMEYGFFGGATGVFKNNFYINGKLKYHRDCNLIYKFLKDNGIVDIIELSDFELEDIGSILFLENNRFNSAK